MHWRKSVDQAVGIVEKAAQYYGTAKTIYNVGKFLGTTVMPMIL